MSASLLEKTRQLNKLIQKAAGRAVDYDDMARVLSSLINCNVYLVDHEGRILGYCLLDDFECDILMREVLAHKKFPEDYNSALLHITDTSPNIKQEGRKCVFKKEESCIFEGKVTTIVPITGAGERLGTLLLARYSGSFNEDDLLLAEYGATVVAMEMLRAKSEHLEEEARKKAAVQIAIGTLSYSELEAVQHIFDALNGSEGFLVASKIAEKVGITRSVIVNALRKFESAGVIESRSLGMKGTYIRVLNDRLIEELRKLRR
ncbi:MAG: GTP-sensing pleiotropic transcriptional regulator CodY [Bacillota bacterium]